MMEDVWAAYHECGHAIVAIASGCVGSIYIKGCQGAVEVEKWSEPVGRRMEMYSAAGAVAEAMARNAFEGVADEENPLILDDVKADVFGQYPPSAEDFEGIEALTDGLVDETFAFLAARWDSLEELLEKMEGRDVLWFPLQAQDIATRAAITPPL